MQGTYRTVKLWRRVGITAGLVLLVVAVTAAVLWRVGGGLGDSGKRPWSGRPAVVSGADVDPKTNARLSSAPRADGGNLAALDRDQTGESPFLSSHIGGAGAMPSPGSADSTKPSVPGVQSFVGAEQSMTEGAAAEGNLLRPQPSFTDGLFRGYRVYPGRDRAHFNEVGLRPGDLVLAIDGNELDGAVGDAAALRRIGGGVAAMLTVERDGRIEYIFVD